MRNDEIVFEFVRMDDDKPWSHNDLPQHPQAARAGNGPMLSLGSPFFSGPVAQLGARFHGMEEVESSNLSRSTKLLEVQPFTSASTPIWSSHGAQPIP